MMKLKLEEEYSYLKLWSMCNKHIMWMRLTLFCFSLILLIMILFSVSNRFIALDCWSLHWGKTDWTQFTPVIAFSKLDYPLIWRLLFFISLQNCCFRRSEFNNILLYQNEGVGNSHKNINIRLPFYYSPSLLPSPL